MCTDRTTVWRLGVSTVVAGFDSATVGSSVWSGLVSSYPQYLWVIYELVSSMIGCPVPILNCEGLAGCGEDSWHASPTQRNSERNCDASAGWSRWFMCPRWFPNEFSARPHEWAHSHCIGLRHLQAWNVGQLVNHKHFYADLGSYKFLNQDHMCQGINQPDKLSF